MKGEELPINTLVIIVIAIIILLAVLYIFSGSFVPASKSISLETAKNNACRMLASRGCAVHPNAIAIEDFDADKNGAFNPGPSNCGCQLSACGPLIPFPHTQADNLWNLCTCWLNTPQTHDGCIQCFQICGCDDVNNVCG